MARRRDHLEADAERMLIGELRRGDRQGAADAKGTASIDLITDAAATTGATPRIAP
jgi:hypothetical protein